MTIDINKVKKYASFKFDIDLELDYKLLKFMYESDDPCYTEDRKKLLLPIINKFDQETNKLLIKHSNRHGLGRFYANESISPICVSRYIKHTLFEYLGWVDLDMVKGHPTILYEVALKNNIKLKSFQNYLTNNIKIFNELITFYFGNNEIDYDKKKDKIKDIFNRLIYGGSFNTWIDDMNEESIELLTNDTHYFITEF